jgi:hypothetical protein
MTEKNEDKREQLREVAREHVQHLSGETAAGRVDPLAAGRRVERRVPGEQQDASADPDQKKGAEGAQGTKGAQEETAGRTDRAKPDDGAHKRGTGEVPSDETREGRES